MPTCRSPALWVTLSLPADCTLSISEHAAVTIRREMPKVEHEVAPPPPPVGGAHSFAGAAPCPTASWGPL